MRHIALLLCTGCQHGDSGVCLALFSDWNETVALFLMWGHLRLFGVGCARHAEVTHA